MAESILKSKLWHNWAFSLKLELLCTKIAFQRPVNSGLALHDQVHFMPLEQLDLPFILYCQKSCLIFHINLESWTSRWNGTQYRLRKDIWVSTSILAPHYVVETKNCTCGDIHPLVIYMFDFEILKVNPAYA